MARLAAYAALLALFHVTMAITVQEFFKDTKPALIKWAHAVNNKTLLEHALNKTNGIHMIEADVNLGRLSTDPVDANATKKIPIMHHDTDNAVSDLSLEEFLKKVVHNKTRGIKLDFKTTEAFEASVKIIKHTTNITQIPVWINADILEGPGGKAPNVTAASFLEKVAKDLNNTLISVGWTTVADVKPGQNTTTDAYTSAQIKSMVEALKSSNVGNQSVTYPVRAALAANDAEVLNTLLSNTTNNNPTLTIWSAEGDKVNVTGLKKLLDVVGRNKIYVDVPADLASQLDLNGAFSVKSSAAVLLLSLVSALFATLHL